MGFRILETFELGEPITVHMLNGPQPYQVTALVEVESCSTRFAFSSVIATWKVGERTFQVPVNARTALELAQLAWKAHERRCLKKGICPECLSKMRWVDGAPGYLDGWECDSGCGEFWPYGPAVFYGPVNGPGT